MPFGVNQNIRRFHIAVQHAARVRVRQRIGDRANDVEDLRNREPLFAHHLFERFAFDELQNEKGQPLVLAEIVDGHDVRMVEFGDHRGFAL